MEFQPADNCDELAKERWNIISDHIERHRDDKSIIIREGLKFEKSGVATTMFTLLAIDGTLSGSYVMLVLQYMTRDMVNSCFKENGDFEIPEYDPKKSIERECMTGPDFVQYVKRRGYKSFIDFPNVPKKEGGTSGGATA